MPPPPPIRTTGYEVVPLDTIEPHPENVNEGDVGAICESLDALGFYGACLVQESSRRILAGEHRWRAAQAEGMTEIPVLWVDVDDDDATRIMLGDNRLARLGRNNEAMLSRVLADLAQRPGGFAGTGYDPDDLDRLLRGLTVEPPAEFASVGDVPTQFRCPSCRHEWSGNPRPGGDE